MNQKDEENSAQELPGKDGKDDIPRPPEKGKGIEEIINAETGSSPSQTSSVNEFNPDNLIKLPFKKEDNPNSQEPIDAEPSAIKIVTPPTSLGNIMEALAPAIDRYHILDTSNQMQNDGYILSFNYNPTFEKDLHFFSRDPLRYNMVSQSSDDESYKNSVNPVTSHISTRRSLANDYEQRPLMMGEVRDRAIFRTQKAADAAKKEAVRILDNYIKRAVREQKELAEKNGTEFNTEEFSSRLMQMCNITVKSARFALGEKTYERLLHNEPEQIFISGSPKKISRRSLLYRIAAATGLITGTAALLTTGITNYCAKKDVSREFATINTEMNALKGRLDDLESEATASENTQTSEKAQTAEKNIIKDKQMPATQNYAGISSSGTLPKHDNVIVGPINPNKNPVLQIEDFSGSAPKHDNVIVGPAERSDMNGSDLGKSDISEIVSYSKALWLKNSKEDKSVKGNSSWFRYDHVEIVGDNIRFTISAQDTEADTALLQYGRKLHKAKISEGKATITVKKEEGALLEYSGIGREFLILGKEQKKGIRWHSSEDHDLNLENMLKLADAGQGIDAATDIKVKEGNRSGYHLSENDMSGIASESAKADYLKKIADYSQAFSKNKQASAAQKCVSQCATAEGMDAIYLLSSIASFNKEGKWNLSERIKELDNLRIDDYINDAGNIMEFAGTVSEDYKNQVAEVITSKIEENYKKFGAVTEQEAEVLRVQREWQIENNYIPLGMIAPLRKEVGEIYESALDEIEIVTESFQNNMPTEHFRIAA
ncbi:MAG TPA: hypothetical protein VJI75_06155 [Candidatus Nanoarchaeia archaeon]|nr:hypothetical protein [Candidatus Nanoarchaeia archaeon]